MYYPQSISKFIFFGFFLVGLPLVVALVEQNQSLNRLAEESRKSVFESSRIAQLSQELYEQSTTLDRLARQYTILLNPAQINNYEHEHNSFNQILTQLEGAYTGEKPDWLGRVRAEESRLWLDLQQFATQSGKNVEALTDGFQAFVKQTRQVRSEAEEVAQLAVEGLTQTAHNAQRQWRLLMWMSLFIAVALAFFLAQAIARPFKALDRAIRRLGSADFSREIEVKGPKDLQQLGQRLDWLRTRLQTLEDQQTRFLRNISHDLKTPLTAIREGAELLRDGVGGRLKTEQQEIVQIVRDNAISLQSMIERLLKFHQARALEPERMMPTDLEKVVRHIVAEHRLTAMRRLISVDLHLSPVSVKGDTQKIETIVDNLLSNAIKYSPRLGKITVHLKLENSFARLDVEDIGSGIPLNEREKIFETFYQGAPPKEHRVKGSGLGLAITKEYVMAHNGKIEAGDRADGKTGARLTVWLPIHENARAKEKVSVANYGVYE
jgi:two-component system sensor histidine kinase GlrK